MTVEQLKSQRKTKKNSFNAFVKRRDATRNIINNIDSKMDDDVRDINNHISSCISELRQGLKGSSKATRVCSEMESAKERGIGYDSVIAACRENLSSEVSRCQGKINALDSEIRLLENQIRAQGGTVYFWE